MLTPGFGGGMTDAKSYVGQRANDREDCQRKIQVRGELAEGLVAVHGVASL